jgi:hypothetical protein
MQDEFDAQFIEWDEERKKKEKEEKIVSIIDHVLGFSFFGLMIVFAFFLGKSYTQETEPHITVSPDKRTQERIERLEQYVGITENSKLPMPQQVED